LDTFSIVGRDRVNRPLTESRTCIRTDQIPTVKATVGAVNELGKELGFTLDLGVERSEELRECSDITLTSSQPIHSDFFSGTGVFWSTEVSVSAGMRMAKEVSAQDTKTILSAELAGVNTFQIISDEIQNSASSDPGRWQRAMEKIDAQLHPVRLDRPFFPGFFEMHEKG